MGTYLYLTLREQGVIERIIDRVKLHDDMATRLLTRGLAVPGGQFNVHGSWTKCDQCRDMMAVFIRELKEA